MSEKQVIELRQNLTNKIAEARNLVEEGKVPEAEAITAECEEIRSQIKSFEKVIELESEVRENEIVEEGGKEEIMNETKLEARSVLVKALAGKNLSTEERDLLVEGTAGDDQTSGAYIVPEDVKTQINEFRRQYVSLKGYVDVTPTTTNAGSFVYEKTSTMTELADLTEGQDITETALEFDKKTYTIKDKGALLPVSNTLLQDEQGGLFSYIGRWFSRKAVKTENSDIITALKGGKTSPVAIASVKDLAKEINVSLDPALLDGSIVLTNQDGYAVLDAEVDEMGRPMLQPDPTSATRKLFKGLPVVVLSNANLASANNKAPIFMGNMAEAIRFMDRGVYELATSKEAGFTKNITYLRAIERYDVVLKDADAYVYGEISTTVASI